MPAFSSITKARVAFVKLGLVCGPSLTMNVLILIFSPTSDYLVVMSSDQKMISSNGMPSKWLINYLVRHGINEQDIAPILSSAIPTGLDAENHVLPVGDYLALMEWASRSLKDPILGVHIADEVNPGEYGILGHLLSNCPSLRTRLDFIQKYHSIFSSDFAYSFIYSKKTSWCIYFEASHVGVGSQQDVLFSMAVALRIIREHTRSDWMPLQSCFTFPLPKDIKPYVMFFGSNLFFGCSENKFEFETKLLDSPTQNADSTLLSILLQQADYTLDQIAVDETITEKVRLLIVASLGEEFISATRIAEQLNMSARSLNRHLKLQKTSYRELRHGVIIKVAKEALVETDISISELAARLGYSETSAFDRAFKSKVNISPKRYRMSYRNKQYI